MLAMQSQSLAAIWEYVVKSSGRDHPVDMNFLDWVRRSPRERRQLEHLDDQYKRCYRFASNILAPVSQQ